MADITTLKEMNEGKTPSKKRSSHWSTTRKHHLEKNAECALCGNTKKLNVHHIKPFHLHPELELEESNLITLCEDRSNGVYCHLFFGHLGSYKDINPDVLADVALWREKLKNRRLLSDEESETA
jgi:hypothetical protein